MAKYLNNRWTKLSLGALISVFFLWLALGDLDWSAVADSLRSAQWGYVPLVFVIWSLGLGARAVRWRVMMGGRVKLSTCFHVLNIGFLINNTLPLRVGEVVRAYLIGRDDSSKISGWAAISTIGAERILDVLATVVILAMVLPVLPVDDSVITAGSILGAIAVVGFGLLILFAHRQDWAHTFLQFGLRLFPFLERLKLDTLLDRILDGLQPLTSWRGLLGALLWTAISWFFSVTGSWTLAQIFPELIQTEAIYAALALTVVAASFSIIIPLTIASVGPFEAATVFAFETTIHLPHELAVTYALVWHAGSVLVYAIWGVIGLMALGLSLSEVQREASSFGETGGEDEAAATASSQAEK